MMKWNLAYTAFVSASLALTGCGIASSTSNHTISMDQDYFSQEMGDRKVECRNWVIKVDGKTIPIEKKKSKIRVEQKGDKINVFVNGQQVHEE